MTSTFWGGLAAGLVLGLSAWADPLPDLAPLALEMPTTVTAPPNPLIEITWGVTNQGAGTALSYWNDILYVSTRSVVDSTANFLVYETGPAALDPGDIYWRTDQLTLPVTERGFYYVILKANAYRYLRESNFDNNELAVGFSFEPTPADLAPLDLVVTPTVTGPPNPLVTVAWGVTNLGPGYASGYWSDTLYLSTHTTFDGTAIPIVSQGESGPVPARGQYWRTNTVRMPVVESGQYYLLFRADQYNSLYEAQTNNNLAVVPVTFDLHPPDLVPVGLVVPNVLTGAPNPEITLSWGVTNQGTGPAIGNYTWWDRVYFSTNTTFEWTDAWVTGSDEAGPIGPGEVYWRTNTAVLPVVDSGNYYLIFQTDFANSIYESDTNNNTLVVPITVNIQRPDLVPIARFPTEITGPPYPLVDLVFGATNQGAGPALGWWLDFVFVSTNTAGGAQGSGTGFSVWGPVPAGGTYWQTNTIRLPAVQDGTYFLTLASDYYSNLYESDRSNNVISVPVAVHILPPDLAPVSLLLPAAITSAPNPALTFVWGITNQGIGPALGNGSWSDLLYVSTNSVWDNTATALNWSYEPGPVNAGDGYWRTNVLHVPVVRSGTYYFFLKADASDTLFESQEGNNELELEVQFTIQPPDLALLVSQVPTQFTGPPNPTLNLVWGVTNQGSGLAQGYWSGWYDSVFLSDNQVLDDQDLNVSAYLEGGPLAPSASYWRTNAVQLPVTKNGTYYLIFQADRGNALFESNKSNNIAIVPLDLTVLPPDLVPLGLEVPTLLTGSPNPSLTLVWGVTNQGTGPAVMNTWPWSDTVYFSRNAFLDSSDVAIGSKGETGPIGPGESYRRTNTVQVPVGYSTNCYLIFKTDSYDGVYESNETNNTIAVPLRVSILSPDLAPIAFLISNSVTGPPRPVLTFVWGVTNQGPGLAAPGSFWSWSDRVYLSTNGVVDSRSVLVTDSMEINPIPAGGSYWRTNFVPVPVLESGTYYLIFTADSSRTLYESDFANNTVRVPVTFTIQRPDLAVLGLQAQPSVSGPPRPSVTVVWGVTNQGIGPAIGGWQDSLYVSAKPVFDYSAMALLGISEPGPIEVGGTYWRTNTLTLPIVQSGKYYLLFETDSGNGLYETDTANNRASLPLVLDILPPDLVPLSLQVTNLVIGPPNPRVTFSWGVTNQGQGAAIPNSDYWIDEMSLCPSPGTGVDCTVFGNSFQGQTVPAGGSYWQTNTLRVPVVESGTYYVRLTVDRNVEVLESNFTNNDLTVPVTFQILPPDVAPIAFQAPSTVTGTPYPQVKLSWGVTNQGLGTADGTWWDGVSLSTKPVLDADARAVAWTTENGPITPGGNDWRSRTVSLPVAESGQYYLILTVDTEHSLYDLNYSNNTMVVPITVSIEPPDLAPIAFQAPRSISGAELTNVTFIWGVTNQGTGPAGSFNVNSCDSIVLSTSPEGTWSDTLISSECAWGMIPAGGSYWKTNTVRLRAIPSGNYYFLLHADSNNSVPESNETNNTMVLPVTVDAPLPDLAPVSIQLPTMMTSPPTPALGIVYAVTNQGKGLAVPWDTWLDQMYLSQTNVLDGSEVPIGWFYEQTPVLPGSAYTRTNLIHLPVYQSGSYYLLLRVDSYNYLPESDEGNNVLAVPITFDIVPSDVAAIGLHVSPALVGAPYPTVEVSWGVTNQGPSEAIGGWAWWQAAYVSTVPTLDFSALNAFAFSETNTLPPGAAEWFTNRVILPLTSSGQYYLILTANAQNSLGEWNTNNDVAVVPFSFSMTSPDLKPIALLAPERLSVPPFPWITLAWGVTNQGLSPAVVQQPWALDYWLDSLWISTSSNLDSAATFIGSFSEAGPVEAGQSYWRTNRVQLPISQGGNYYLIFAANYSGSLLESDASNNAVAVPITLTITPPDLTPLILQAPSLVIGEPFPEITVVWGVTNQGSGPAQVPYTPPGVYPWPLADALYLSSTPTVEDPWYATTIALWPRNNDFLPATGFTYTNTVRVPLSSSGTYYLVFRTDALQTAVESDESNNTLAVPITFRLAPPADLTALALIAPKSVSGPGNPVVTVAWHVSNQGLGPTGEAWWDTIELRRSYAPEVPIGSFFVSGPLLPGTDYWQTNTLILPVAESGDYELTLRAGVGFGFFDLDTQDNSISVPLAVRIEGEPVIRLANPQRLPSGVFQVQVYAALGKSYTLQGSTDLLHWVRVLDFSCTENPLTLQDHQARYYPWRYYRVGPLTIPPPLHLQAILTPRYGLVLGLDGPLGETCQIEASTDLVTWQQVTNLTVTTAPLYFQDPATTNFEQRFYRAVVPVNAVTQSQSQDGTR